MNNHLVSRIAIYILSVVMIAFGINHFRHPKDLFIYVPAFLPGGIIWVYIVGVFFILAAISFLANKMVQIAAYLLALMLFIFVLTIHLPNYLHSGEVEMQNLAFINLLKDSALAAFALHIGSNAKTVG